MFGKKHSGKSSGKEARLEEIRALGAPADGKKKKKGHEFEEEEQRINQLIVYLRDEEPECRIAAAKILGTTSRDAAITHLNFQMSKESDPEVIQAMQDAVKGIRENIRRLHEAKAAQQS